MTYKEIEKIAIENGWTTTSDATLYRIEKEYEDRINHIVVGKFSRNVIFVNNEICNPGDLIVIKAAIKLAETPTGERILEENKLKRGRKMRNNPDHYKIDGKDTIKTIIGIVDNNHLKAEESIYLFNTLKYLVRFNNKNGEDDLMKAKNYLERLMEVYKRRN